MITLLDYINNNRNKTKPTVKEVGFGEMFSNVKSIYYDLPINGKEYSIFAFVAIPNCKKPKNGFPAILLIHGGNGAAYFEIAKKWADKGYVAITPDFNGMCSNNLLDRCIVNKNGGPKGYGNSGISTENPWVYFSILSAMRAVDVLCSYDFVNKAKVVSCGLSWGGFLNLMLTAFDKRIKASSIIYSSAFTYLSEWGNKILSNSNDEEKEKYIKYLEPKNYLSNITIPTLFTAGADDRAFKMINRQMTADGIKGTPYYALRKSFYHGNFYGFEQNETCSFFYSVLHNKKVPMPSYKISGNFVKVKPGDYKSKIRFIYTEDSLIKTERQKWKFKRPFKNLIFELNSKITAFFITEETLNGEKWSSKIEIL